MTRDQSNARWHARQGLRSSGLTMKEFAQREGFCAPSAYRWLRKARRAGLWSDEPKPAKAMAVTKPRGTAVFARVAVSDTPSRSSMLRLVLTNGRRAELEIGGRATRRVARLARALRMIRPTAAAVVYLCVAPTDLRKQAASLALLVERSCGHHAQRSRRGHLVQLVTGRRKRVGHVARQNVRALHSHFNAAGKHSGEIQALPLCYPDRRYGCR